ncbi:hypothetical protein Fmac_000911 [Flemingia macrophylla]|uniref:Uncharacterized protein n=1 Tax=Flemingia macrophylla TaxID=520843 RepID=A0ABD1NFQ8_9FABA
MPSSHFSNGNSESLLRLPLLSSQRSIVNSGSQVAIVGSNVSPIESLDYEVCENEFVKLDWRRRGKTQIFRFIFMKWLLCIFIGMIVCLVGFFIGMK